MKALVVYESLYGNTAALGEAIAAALRDASLEVRAGPVTDIEPTEAADADLLLVGGPTHAHGMSRPSTRQAGATDKKNVYPTPTVEPGLREWIDRLAPGAPKLAAAFDTRFDKPLFLTGSAAKGIGRRLERRGFRLVVGPESFFVSTDNRLSEGELEHAARWGKEVGGAVTSGAEVQRAPKP